MSTGNILKEHLIRELEKLPETRLQEVLDFIGYLLSQEHKPRATKPQEELDPTKDPILGFIGGVSHGSLAQDIDRELYGA
jgi:hypothetical protein